MKKYKFFKDREFEIYNQKFGKTELIGIGKYTGHERCLILTNHGAYSQLIPTFTINNNKIYGTDCEYKPKGKKTSIVTTELDFSNEIKYDHE